MQFGHLIPAPKVAAGLSPGLQPGFNPALARPPFAARSAVFQEGKNSHGGHGIHGGFDRKSLRLGYLLNFGAAGFKTGFNRLING
jgi:hypothetical protein